MAAILSALRGRGKPPAELVRLARTGLDELLQTDENPAPPTATGERRSEEGSEAVVEAPIEKRLRQMKELVYGDANKEVDENAAEELADRMVNGGLMVSLLEHLGRLPFEAKKYTAELFCNFVRKPRAGFDAYLTSNEGLLDLLIESYGNSELGVLCGMMLREATKHEGILRLVLYDDRRIWTFFDSLVHKEDFALSSDAFSTLRQMLTENRDVASAFLFERYDAFFEKYSQLLNSENYATKRQSIKLLSQLLLDRKNYRVMIRYIGEKQNLKQIMNLLRDRHANIQFEAFHVFKVFVANPQKEPEIQRVLLANQEKLVAFLSDFQNDKDDEQFTEEKHLLITTLSNLAPEGAAGGEGGAAAAAEAPAAGAAAAAEEAGAAEAGGGEQQGTA